MSATIGCVGLGEFGARVAARLGRQGFSLYVFDSWIEPARYFMTKNVAGLAENPRTLAVFCDVVVCVLPDAAATRQVAIGPLGLAEGLSDGRDCVLVDLGTTSAAEARALAADLAARGVRYVEAPARGSPMDARDGRLIIPVGGASADIDRARPALDALGARVAHVGEIGAAHAMSGAVGLARASMLLALKDAEAVAASVGVEAAALREWCVAEALMTPAFDALARGAAAGADHSIEAVTAQLRALADVLAEKGVRAPRAQATIDFWNEASRTLGAQRDVADIARLLEGAIEKPAPPAVDAPAV